MAKINSIGNRTYSLKVNDAYALPSVDGANKQALTTDGAGNVTWKAQASAGIAFEDVTATTKTMSPDSCYYANNASGVKFTLPATASQGQSIEVIGIQGLWEILQNAGQTIFFGTDQTTTGVSGKIVSDTVGDCIGLKCIVENTSWRVFYYWGSFHKEG